MSLLPVHPENEDTTNDVTTKKSMSSNEIAEQLAGSKSDLGHKGISAHRRYLSLSSMPSKIQCNEVTSQKTNASSSNSVAFKP